MYVGFGCFFVRLYGVWHVGFCCLFFVWGVCGVCVFVCVCGVGVCVCVLGVLGVLGVLCVLCVVCVVCVVVVRFVLLTDVPVLFRMCLCRIYLIALGHPFCALQNIRLYITNNGY